MAEWYPAAVQRYGPAHKIGRYPGLGLTAPKVGEIKHSMVGRLSDALRMLDSDEEVSWPFSVAYDGTVLQHYPANAICWHAGGPRWNIDTVGVEHEGGPPGAEGEPLRQAQVDATVRLSAWLAEQFGRRAKVGRYPDTADWWLLEHNQVKATACPSGRIPWPAILKAVSTILEPPVALPTVPEVEHASPWLAAAYYKKDKSLLHSYDAGVLDRALAWYRAG